MEHGHCNLSYIVDLFAGLHELASASVRTLLKLASSVRALLKPYGDTLILICVFPSYLSPKEVISPLGMRTRPSKFYI